MGAKILTISIKQEHFKFLEENPHFSPSEIMQEAIENLINYQRKQNYSLEEWKSKAENLIKEVQVLHSFMEANNLTFKQLNEWRQLSKDGIS